VTELPWGMYFPSDPTNQLRHPTQLYEALFEGVVLFVILWYLRKKKWFNGLTLSVYFIGYGIIRFFIENIRQPSPISEAKYLGFMNLAQVMSVLMIAAGLIIIMIRKDKPYLSITKEENHG
ncbi:MAG: prolipoprotein diacylglyceryl transferase, partial [bacterium]